MKHLRPNFVDKERSTSIYRENKRLYDNIVQICNTHRSLESSASQPSLNRDASTARLSVKNGTPKVIVNHQVGSLTAGIRKIQN